tara:strand:+ start:226 stop:342 length:117 start_codon:yes stop_codon:yes gene_type:complete
MNTINEIAKEYNPIESLNISKIKPVKNEKVNWLNEFLV